jgi:formamidopyrimidine-DNA glycosylase
MPELPEVETVRQGITPHIMHHAISQVILRRKNLRWPIPSNLPELLQGHSIISVERRGKYILLNFAHGTLILHLGMSGVLRITNSTVPAAKHDHVDIEFTNGICLRFTDPRRFGCVLWTEEDSTQHRLLAHLGPEPLTRAFSAKYLYERTRNKSVAIKLLLMNHEQVVGVGNIYANEALFLAQVHPKRAANKLTLTDCQRLVTAVKKILRQAIAHGGTTLKDFSQSDGKPGYFRHELAVYGRAGEHCYDCASPLKSLRLNNRATVYCPSCQH